MRVDVTFSATDNSFAATFGEVVPIPGGDYGGFGRGYVQGFEEAIFAALNLPAGYTQLEYIETTGTQWINTGFIPNQDSRILCEFMFKGGVGIYGTRQSTTLRNFAVRVINSAWQPGYNAKLGSSGIKSDTTEWHVADQNKNMFYIDGVLGYEFEYAAFTAPKSIALGGINANNSFYYGQGKYRFCQIYDNGVLVRNLVPCKDPDGVVGMYDTLNSKFYGNAGTGDLVAGAEIH